MTWTEPVELTRAISTWARADEDLAQDMRLAAWRASIRPGADPARLTGLMIRAARNARANVIRDRLAKRRDASSTVPCANLSEGEMAPLTAPVEWTPLMRLVPPTLLRMALHGAELGEIAAAEGVTRTAIWLRHERACAKLRILLTTEFE